MIPNTLKKVPVQQTAIYCGLLATHTRDKGPDRRKRVKHAVWTYVSDDGHGRLQHMLYAQDSVSCRLDGDLDARTGTCGLKSES